MATKTLVQSGADGVNTFDRITAWLDTLPAVLTEPERLQVSEGVHSLTSATVSIITGKTTSPLNFIEVFADAPQRPDGVPRAVSGSGATFNFGVRVEVDHFRLTGVEAQANSSAAFAVFGSRGADSDIRVEECYLQNQLTGTSYTVATSVAGLNLNMKKTVVVGNSRSIDTRTAATALIENCTFWRHALQIGCYSGSEAVYNNCYSGKIGTGSTSDYAGEATGNIQTGTNNIASDSSATTRFTNSLDGVQGADVFLSITPGAENFNLKTGAVANPLIDRGVGARTFQATVPSAPLNPVATAGAGRVRADFDAPASSGGAAIEEYVVAWSEGQQAAGTESPIWIEGTPPGVAGTFAVRARNSKGFGPASSASNIVTPTAIILAPTAAITGVAVDGQNVTVSGTTANTPTGGQAAIIDAQSGAIVQGPKPLTLGVGTFSAGFTALPPGTYSETVTVTNDGGANQATGAAPFTIVGIGGGGPIDGDEDSEPLPSDTAAPTVTAATVASSAPGVVVLTASEPLDATPAALPSAGAFQIAGHTVSGVTISGSAINLSVTPNFANGETPRTVAYTQPAANGARDIAGNLLASFVGRAIANNVAAPISTITGVTINPTAATLAGGATQVFTGAAQGTNSPAQTFNWTRNPAVGTITGNGTNTGTFVLPAATNVVQTIEVTATSTQDPNYAATATVTVPAAAPAGTSFTRSLSRTIKVKPAPQMFEGGPFWNTTNKTRPVGTIDKDETIDVSFDLAEVLADIADTVKQIDFDLAGLTSVGGYFTGAVATVFVSNAVALGGGKNPSITCRMTTNSTPPRVEDWTVELKIEEQ